MIQLNIKTEFSFGETFAPIDRCIERCKELGVTHAGIVDRDGTWGHVAWWNACKEADITPLLGVDLIVSDDDERETRMWFLAKNQEGLKELYRASTLAHRQMLKAGSKQRPRLYEQDVVDMSENIIKFAGQVTDPELLKDCNAVIDLSPASKLLNAAKRRIASEHNLPIVKVSDNAFAFEDDRQTFELATNAGLKPSPQYIVEDVDASEIDVPELFDLPCAPMIRAEGDLEKLCQEGIEFRKKHNGLVWDEEHQQRLERELSLIKQKDYESYFIIVADMINYAKKHMLVGPSRGSSAGSLVCYLTRITEIDPIPPGLFFERFIDLNRSDLPDIDVDFPDNKRHLVFEYMAETYGSGNTAHIGTVNEFKPKSALIQVCKKLSIPPSATTSVKISMIERSSADRRASSCLEDTLKETDPGRQLVKMYPEVVRAGDLEGHASHTGVHAAGLLVCNENISDFCTVTEKGIAQVEKKAAEQLGLLKIDALGLRTLGILEDSGIEQSWYEMTFDDPNVYNVFNEGRLCGIFQFEGNALRSISTRINFTELNDVDAVTALARPGPFGGGVTGEYMARREGKPYKALHPSVEPHMALTFGLPVYQEQTLSIVREIGKFSWEQTSTIRKAMSKRMGKEYFDSFWPQFKDGAAEVGMNEVQAKETWDLINAMGAWQMNKAHTYSYAVISYWTAWLKHYHPLEFAAANLRNAKSDDSALELLREMVREGLEYVPFDPELSEETWAVKDGKLIAGFDALHGFGEKKAKKVVEDRDNGTLSDAQKKKIKEAKSVYDDIFPCNSKFKHLYENENEEHVRGKVLHMDEITDNTDGSIVFLGKIIYKNLRDGNEEVNVKKRGGKRWVGQTTFLDLRIQDDTGQILCRIGRYDYKRMGEYIFESVPEGSYVLIRANLKKGIRFGWVQNIRVLEMKEK